MPQGSYDVKNTPVSQAVTEHVLAYLASDEVYVKMDASDSKASVHIENAKKIRILSDGSNSICEKWQHNNPDSRIRLEKPRK